MRSLLSLSFAAAVAVLSVDAAAFPQSDHPAMTDPSKAKEKAPDTFRAKFETTKGDIVMECTRAWAPNGVDRFYNLVRIGYFDDIAFFRAVKGFVVQWGIHGDPKVSAAWRSANIPADPPKQSNKRGFVTYAMARSPDTRSTQLFINFGDNSNLDSMGFAPICQVAEGMDIAEKLYAGYGEEITELQGEIQFKGNAYLRSKWPKLDYVKTATIVGEAAPPDRKSKPDTAPSAGADPKDPNKDQGGKDADPEKQESGDNTFLYAIVGVVVVGGAIYLFTRKPEEEKPAPKPAKGEPPKKKKSSSGDEPPKKKKADDDAPKKKSSDDPPKKKSDEKKAEAKKSDEKKAEAKKADEKKADEKKADEKKADEKKAADAKKKAEDDEDEDEDEDEDDDGEDDDA